MRKIMSREKYKEYRKILYNTEGQDPVSVVNDTTVTAKAQRLRMRKKLIEFQEKHGSVHRHLVKSGQDYAQYCMIVNG